MGIGNGRARRPSGVRTLARVLLATTALTAVSTAILSPAAVAQTYLWGGTGSSTTTSTYMLGTNWSNPPAGAPPVTAGKSAEFGATGSQTITLGSSIAAGKWTILPDAQSFTISGGEVYFTDPSGGLFNNANAGQTITISTKLSELSSGLGVTQAGNSTLVLAGIADMSGAYSVTAGSLVFANGANITNAFKLTNSADVAVQAGASVDLQTMLINSGTVTLQGTYRSNDIRNDGTVTISGGADVYLRNYFVSGESANNVNSLTVTGAGTRLRMFDDIIASTAAGANSTITIADGAYLENKHNRIAAEADTTATMIVTGTGTRWLSYGETRIGDGGTGSLTIADKATASLAWVSVGYAAGSTGHLTVTGAGSTLGAYQLEIGGTGTGTLLIANGGTIGTDSSRVSSTLFGGTFSGPVGGTGGTGTGVITGAGSALYSTSTFVGYQNTGTLTLSDGGKLVGGWLYLGIVPGTSGTLNIGAASGETPVAPGEFAVSIIFPALNGGSSTIVFNHTSTNYSFGSYFLGYSTSGTNTVIFENGTTNFNAYVQGGMTAFVNGGRANFNSVGLDTVVTVNAGGTLGGYGQVRTVTVNAGGTYAGNLSTAGNFTMSAGATYRYTPSSLTTVGGIATLGGASLSFKALSFSDQTYTVLTATGGVGGTFVLAPETGSAGSVVYNPNDVQLTIKGYRAGTALTGSGSVNVANVAAGIDGALNGGAAPPAAFNGLLGLTGAPLAATLNRLTGEAGTGAVATGLSGASTFLGIMLDPMGGSRGGTASAPGSSLVEMADLGAARTPAARVEAAWSIWTRAYGQANRTASDAGPGAAGTASSTYGVAAGADKLSAPGLVVGFALAGGGTSFGLGNLGSGTGDFAQLGAYASMRLGPGYLSAALAYGWNRFDVTRTVAALGLTETYRSGPVGHTFGGRIETGRRFDLGPAGALRFGLTPYVAAEAIAYVSPGYRETWIAPATGAFALAYAGRTTGTLRAELGARADALVASAGTGDLIAFSRLAYAVQTNTQRAADAQFQALAGSSFTVFGARASTHTALGSIGLEARFRQGFAASLALDGEVGDRHRALRGSVGIRQSW